MGQSGTIVEATSQVQVLTQPVQALTEVESVEDDQIKKDSQIYDVQFAEQIGDDEATVAAAISEAE